MGPAPALRRLAAALVLAVSAGSAAAQQARIYEAPEDLPAGEGREETFYLCSACHGFQVVARQGMTRSRWEDTYDLMIERHGMFDPGPEEREAILAYLAEAYPPPEGGRGWQNPFLNR